MRTQTLAHVSDLHLGKDKASREAAEQLCSALLEQRIDHVVVTGDVTHRGRIWQLALFRRLFAPLLRAGRVSVVPGNHDRLWEDAGSELMSGPRVQVEKREGLYLVRFDSTAPHNRSLLASHGAMHEADSAAILSALDAAPSGALVVLTLHHHLLPLPEEGLFERACARLGWPWTAELPGGRALVERMRDRCDLVLHGHRHVPSELTLAASRRRPLSVFNAGATLEQGRVRVFRHRNGGLCCEPEWLGFAGGVDAPALRPAIAGAMGAP